MAESFMRVWVRMRVTGCSAIEKIVRKQTRTGNQRTGGTPAEAIPLREHFPRPIEGGRIIRPPCQTTPPPVPLPHPAC